MPIATYTLHVQADVGSGAVQDQRALSDASLPVSGWHARKCGNGRVARIDRDRWAVVTKFTLIPTGVVADALWWFR